MMTICRSEFAYYIVKQTLLLSNSHSALIMCELCYLNCIVELSIVLVCGVAISNLLIINYELHTTMHLELCCICLDIVVLVKCLSQDMYTTLNVFSGRIYIHYSNVFVALAIKYLLPYITVIFSLSPVFSEGSLRHCTDLYNYYTCI